MSGATIDLGSCVQGAEFEIILTFTDPDAADAAVDPSPLTATTHCVLTNTDVVYTYNGTDPQDAYFTRLAQGQYRLGVDTTASGGDYTGYTTTPQGASHQQSGKFKFYVNPIP